VATRSSDRRAAIELRKQGAQSIGCANNHAPVWPASDDDADVGASKIYDGLWNGMFLEPMLLGHYPVDLAPLLDGLAEPGDMAGSRADAGCPRLENDLDGVLDAQDKCKDEPEDRDGYDDGDGCPEGDNDKDNVPDLNDRCPGEAEDMDGFTDDDGCPDEDNDGDGILDAKDRCPDESETVNNYQDLDGCPDQATVGGPKLVASGIDLQGEKVEFQGKGDKLTRGAEATLDAVVVIMKANPTIRFRIEVGVEETSKKKKDKDADRALSERRAAAVRAYLGSKGVGAAQLDVAGLGSDRPVDRDPKSQKNRRVEFIRLNQ